MNTSPSSLTGIFVVYRIWGLAELFFLYFKAKYVALLSFCIFSLKFYHFHHYYSVHNLFSLTAFIIFSLLIFNNLNMLCLDKIFFVFLVLGASWISSGSIFFKFGKFWTITFSNAPPPLFFKTYFDPMFISLLNVPQFTGALSFCFLFSSVFPYPIPHHLKKFWIISMLFSST